MGLKLSKKRDKKKSESTEKKKKKEDKRNLKISPATSESGNEKDVEWELKSALFLAKTENVNEKTAKNIMKLLDEGNTIPFMARYRRDMVGLLDANELRKFKLSYEYIKKVNEKGKQIERQVSGADGVTPQLLHSIREAQSLEELEFLAGPFRKENKGTLAHRAKALDLDKPAQLILDGSKIVNLETFVNPLVSDLDDVKKVEKGIQHMIADVISKTPEIQSAVLKIVDSGSAILQSREKTTGKNKEKNSKYSLYENFSQTVRYVKPHQVLAIFRGEAENQLSVKIEVLAEDWVPLKMTCQKKWLDSGFSYELRRSIVINSVDDAIKRLLGPFVARRIKMKLKKEADVEAISVFESNLKQLLLTPPCKGTVIMGIDPGFRNGCKIAVISPQGSPLTFAKVFLPSTKDAPGSNGAEKFSSKIKDLVLKFECTTIALGNGKGCRETETYLVECIERKYFEPVNVCYSIVNEQGVSIYSCSAEASEEFPGVDPMYVGAVSLARRLQDPLSEFVKVEPRHLGVGLYQHDMKSAHLNSALEEIVSECVSFVGVDVNTASFYLLKRVAGLNAAKAREMIRYRQENVSFRTLEDLKKVKGISEKTFLQCAGFLRIRASTAGWMCNPLDQTSIHPESYETATAMANKLGVDLSEVGTQGFIDGVKAKSKFFSTADLAKELSASPESVAFVLETFLTAGDHDIRNAFNGPVYKRGILRLEDLKSGQELTGVVKNVVPFGAFVDVGVGIDGLVHSSKMKGIRLALNDRVTVQIIGPVNLAGKKIPLRLLSKSS